jgi:hypothetical protein
MIYSIANGIPIHDEICRISFNLKRSLLPCDSKLVNFVARHGLYHGRTDSPNGRNAISCLPQFAVMSEWQRNVRLNREFMLHRFETRSSPETVAHANLLKALLIMRPTPVSLSAVLLESGRCIVLICVCLNHYFLSLVFSLSSTNYIYIYQFSSPKMFA